MNRPPQTAVAVTGTGAVSATPAIYGGLSIRDTSGSANTVKIYDNPSAASGTIVAVVQLAANASGGESVDDGIQTRAGVYLSATGAIEGCVRLR